MGARKDESEWAKVIAELEESGSKIGPFCAARRINVKTLSWWRWRLRGAAKASRAKSVRLVAVDVAHGAVGQNESRAIVIAIVGAELRVEVGTDPKYVSALVAALRSPC